MTVCETKLILEKKKVQVQAGIINDVRFELGKLEETLAEKVRWLKDKEYNHAGYEEVLRAVRTIKASIDLKYIEFKKELKGDKEKEGRLDL